MANRKKEVFYVLDRNQYWCENDSHKYKHSIEVSATELIFPSTICLRNEVPQAEYEAQTCGK